MADETTVAATETAEAIEERNRRRVLRGLVTSDKMEQTIVFTVTRTKQHPLYGRTMKSSKKYKAHDEHNEAHIGDTVEVMACRPISKEKSWRLVRVVEKAK
jgi:small subunit ribosomal protein S17